MLDVVGRVRKMGRMTDLEWFAKIDPCHWVLTYNEHAMNYSTVVVEIESNLDDYASTPAHLLSEMRATNRAYRLQIYPLFPVGSHVFHGPTLASVIEQARAANVMEVAP